MRRGSVYSGALLHIRVLRQGEGVERQEGWEVECRVSSATMVVLALRGLGGELPPGGQPGL